MNLKTACKTAMILIIISFVFFLLTEFLNVLMLFAPMTQQGDWASIEDFLVPRSWFVVRSLSSLAVPTLMLGGLITLLSGQIKRLNEPQANIKISSVIAAIFYVLVAGIGVGSAANFLWLSFRYHSDLLSSEFGLDMCLYITMITCSLSLCIFSIKQIHTSGARASGIAALVCQLLYVVVFTSYSGNSLYTFFRGRDELRNYVDLNEQFSCLWLATFTIGYITVLLSVAAITVFLIAWLKQRPLPPEAGVVDPSPQPLPSLSAAQSLPGE